MSPLLLFPALFTVLIIWGAVREVRRIDRRLKSFETRSAASRKGWATRKSRTFIPPKL